MGISIESEKKTGMKEVQECGSDWEFGYVFVFDGNNGIAQNEKCWIKVFVAIFTLMWASNLTFNNCKKNCEIDGKMALIINGTVVV